MLNQDIINFGIECGINMTEEITKQFVEESMFTTSLKEVAFKLFKYQLEGEINEISDLPDALHWYLPPSLTGYENLLEGGCWVSASKIYWFFHEFKDLPQNLKELIRRNLKIWENKNIVLNYNNMPRMIERYGEYMEDWDSSIEPLESGVAIDNSDIFDIKIIIKPTIFPSENWDDWVFINEFLDSWDRKFNKYY